MADCPREGCGQRHKVRRFTQTGYIFECPSGHKWVREDDQADPEGALETAHHQDSQFGDFVRVERVDRAISAGVHGSDEEGNFLLTIPDHLSVRVAGTIKSEPRVIVESDEFPTALEVRDREGSFTEVTLGEGVDE